MFAFLPSLPLPAPPRAPKPPLTRVARRAAPTARILGARGRRRRAGFGGASAASSATDASAARAAATAREPPRTLRRSGMNYPVVLSPELAALLGAGRMMSRADVLSRLCAYVKEHGLYAPASKKYFVCDERLRALFGTRGQFLLLQLQSLVKPHLSPAAEHGEEEVARAEEIFRKYLRERGAVLRVGSQRKKDPRGLNSFKAQKALQAKGEGMYAEIDVSSSMSRLFHGKRRMSRPTILKSVWDYIKENDLQKPNDRRIIVLDDVLKDALQVSHLDSVDCFELPKYVWSQTGRHVQQQRPT